MQRGDVQPLINMLQAPDMQLREMSAFALGRLAQVDAIRLCWMVSFFFFFSIDVSTFDFQYPRRVKYELWCLVGHICL